MSPFRLVLMLLGLLALSGCFSADITWTCAASAQGCSLGTPPPPPAPPLVLAPTSNNVLGGGGTIATSTHFLSHSTINGFGSVSQIGSFFQVQSSAVTGVGSP